jgi:DNA polymerase I
LFSSGYYTIDPLDQVLIDLPEFFSCSNENFVAAMFDIEVMTEKHKPFPKPESSPIIGIGVSILTNNKPPQRFILIDKVQEIRLLQGFKKIIEHFSPDILCGYNSKLFDLPFIIKRLELHNIDNKFLSKTGYIFISKHRHINIAGVVNFDLLESVKQDFALRGIKDKSMKTVAKHYGFENIIEIEDERMGDLINVDEKELYNYLRSDILITEKLFNHYFPIKRALAELLNIPLNLVIDKPPGYLPKILQARVLRSRNIIGDLTNEQKYEELEYTGGEVFFNNKPGIYKPICKIDFVSMYPNIMMQFNLSPDTVSFVEEIKDVQEFKRIDKENYELLYLPEPKLNKTIVIKVLKRRGLITKELKRIFDRRKELKEKYKKAKSPERELFFSQQYALKVLINSVYGFNASNDCLWGDFYIALAITSIGRSLVKHLASLHPEKVIEIDTDGVFFEGILDEKIFEESLKENFKAEFKLDNDKFVSSYFYLAKNYILYDGKKLTIKGNALKSSRTCPLIDKARNIILKEMFTNDSLNSLSAKKALVKEVKTLTINSPLSDFLYSSRAERPLEEYKGNCIQKRLLEAYKNLGKIVPRGEQMYYAIGRTLSPKKKKKEIIVKELLHSKSQLDISYYNSNIKTLLEIFGLNNLEQTTLDKYIGGVTNGRRETKTESLETSA